MDNILILLCIAMALLVCTEQKQTIDWSDQKVNTITPGNKVRNSNQIDGLTSMELLGIICLIFFEVSVFFL